MKLTKSKLQAIIKEEMKGTLNERPSSRWDLEDIMYMDGMVTIRYQKAFKEIVKKIQRELYDEGFEYDQIDKYLQALLNDEV